MSRHDANRLTYDFYMYCYQRDTFEKYRARLKNKARSLAKKRAEPER